MIRTISLIIFALVVSASADGQTRSISELQQEIRDLKDERVIALTYDDGSDSTKLMAISENFSQKEAQKAGLQAMNFAMALTYPGKLMTAQPDKINLTFWVLTKKPMFAEAHRWVTTTSNGQIDLGEARYVAKPSENMEYLNFIVSREDLKKMDDIGITFKLGNATFTFTTSQAKLISDMISLTSL